MSSDSLRATMLAHLEALAVRQYSVSTISSRARDFRLFAAWCEERSVLRPLEVTKLLLERYQRYLFYVRKPNGHPLSVQRQLVLMAQLRVYFSWLTRQNFLPANPASDILLPRLPRRLPRHTLTPAEVEKALAMPDIGTLVGLRDRAALELLWATGLRRAELSSLALYDVDFERGTVFVREGKGKKDRVVPLSTRAAGWLRRYLDDVRPRLASSPDAGHFFLAESGDALVPASLTNLTHDYLVRAGFAGRGSCHLFRHACATAMLEGGADVRFVQELLGHASLETTQVYTHVSISKLKAVYEACHPSANPTVAAAVSVPESAAVLAQLDAEADE
jgi:integrase/recombinase XerD